MMTALLEPREATVGRDHGEPPSGRRQHLRIGDWLRRHRTGVFWLGPLLVVAAVAQGVNMTNAPQRIDDEGTYVAQAWAVENLGSLGHYTYWYDHPPLGWLQLAGWTWLTDAFERAPNAVAAGREAMLVVQLVSVVLLWLLARRLGLARWAAALAVLVFSVSPLAVQFHRTVYLDNLATPWLLAAFVLALSPKRRLAAFAGAGACFAVAALTKETSLLLLPALAWQLWRASDATNRRYALTVAASLFALVGAFYVLFAAVKGELFAGPDHVSLMEGVRFQLSSRVSSGNILDSSSLARQTVDIWWQLDRIGLVLAGLAAVVAVARIRALQPLALGWLVLALMALRPGGYLPVPYVIALLPLGAVLIAGVADRVVRASSRAGRGRSVTAIGVVVAIGALVVLTPTWGSKLRGLVDADLDRPLAQAENWIEENLAADRRIIVDDAIWVDLVEQGFPADNVVWYYKVDTDPAVAALSPRGWKDYDYVVSTESVRSFQDAFPQVQLALDNSLPVAAFGEGDDRVEIRRISETVATGTTERAAGELRATAGAAVAANPAVAAPDDLRESMRAGRVDLRVLSLLAGLAAGGVEVGGLPAVAGEDEAERPRRVVELSHVAGRPVDADDAAVRTLLDSLQNRPTAFRPVEAVVAPDASGRPVVRVVYPVGLASIDPSTRPQGG